MKIAIIGAGNVGQALASAWLRAGHEVSFGVRDPAKPSPIASVPAYDARSAAEAADVTVLALPWANAEQAVHTLGPLANKIVIDCMNPLSYHDGHFELVLGHMHSGGETVADWLPQAHVVKTLNQVGAEVMADASGFKVPPVMFMAGENESSKATVANLLTDLGFVAQDAGGITLSRYLEPLAMVWINQAIKRGSGRNWALALVERG